MHAPGEAGGRRGSAYKRRPAPTPGISHRREARIARDTTSSNSPGYYESELAAVETLVHSTATIPMLEEELNGNTFFNNISFPMDLLSNSTTNFSLDYENYNATDLTAANESWNQFETVVVQVASPMYVYLTPFMVILGISGNLLSTYVFFKTKLRCQSASQYLAALAVSDSMFLLQLLPAWITTLQINLIFHQKGFCKFFVYISYVSCTLSSWLVIAFTIERYIAVQYPLRRPAVCTVKRARYIILALLLGSMLLNIPVLFFVGSGDQECNIDRDYLAYAEIFNWVDTTMTFTVPLLIILILNASIGILVCKMEKTRANLMEDGVEQGQNERESAHSRYQRKITNMLLVVSSVYFIFNLPAYVLRVYAYSYNLATYCRQLYSSRDLIDRTCLDESEFTDTWMTVQIVATILFNTNFGINFFLYCLSGKNFRRALVQCVPCFRWLVLKLNVVRRTTYSHGRDGSVTSLSAASANSNVTEASCNFGFGRKKARRQRKPDKYIYRCKFNNPNQRRAAAAGGRIECFEMSEITSRPGPSRITDARSRPGTSYSVATEQEFHDTELSESRLPVLSRVVLPDKEKKKSLTRSNFQLFRSSGAKRRQAHAYLYD